MVDYLSRDGDNLIESAIMSEVTMLLDTAFVAVFATAAAVRE